MYPNQFDIARAMLKEHEGLRLEEYQDTTGNRTIGYGWNLDACPLPTCVGKLDTHSKITITNAEAEGLLDKAMLTHWSDLTAALPWVAIENDQKQWNKWRMAALLDMAYNLGVPNLLTWKNTLAFMEAGKYGNATENMLKSRWAKQVKRRADVLVSIMRDGKMNDYQISVYGLGGWEYM